MHKNYPNLCSPITLGNVNFRNRMFASPIGATDIDDNCVPGERTRAFYELRAKGGAGAVTMSELVVHPETDGSHMLHLDTKIVGALASYTFCADGIKRQGAVPSIELSHSGQYAGTYMADKSKKTSLTQYGPSDVKRPDGMKVTALTKEQINEIVQAYADAATLAKRVGYEMVMVHAGHTWLLNQFISPFFNKRTDEYGGSFENRIRFTLEVLSAVREAVGVGFPIEVRISGSELFEGGYDLEEGIKIAKAIEPYADLIHVSAGSYQYGFFTTHLSMFSEHGANVYLAAEIKKHVSKPVATIGALNDPKMMEEIIASGKADVVYMGRAILADPYLPRKVEANNEDKIVKCLRCFVCMAERPVTQTRRCTVNPQIGREVEGTDIIPTNKPKKVLVVGGGIAGLKAAVTAAQRGHDVTLCEREAELGGILKCEQAIHFKREMYELGLTLEAQAVEEGVKILKNTTVDAAYIENMKPDALLIAVGSSPIIPNIKGVNGDNVIVVNDYYKVADKIKDTVVVIGGGISGVECAIHLAQDGKKVELIEMKDELAYDANIRQRPILLKTVAECVSSNLELTATEIADKGVLCKDKDGKEVFVEGETVICAVGQRANRDIVSGLIGTAPYVREIGDCVRVANITSAMYQGHHAALSI